MATNWDMFDTYNIQEAKTEEGNTNYFFKYFLTQNNGGRAPFMIILINGY